MPEIAQPTAVAPASSRRFSFLCNKKISPHICTYVYKKSNDSAICPIESFQKTCTFFFPQVSFAKEPLARGQKDAREGRTLIGKFDILTLKLISTLHEFLKETMSTFSVFSEDVGSFSVPDKIQK